MRHYIEDQPVGLLHAIMADARKIANTPVHVILYETFGCRNEAVLYGQHGGQRGRADAAAKLEGATWLSSVAHHPCEIGNHVLDSVGHLLEIAAHQVGNAAATAGAGHYAAAKGTQPAEALLDVNGGEVAHYESACQLLVGVVVVAGVNDYRQGSCNSLVAASRVAHYRNHCACHAGIAGGAGNAQHVGENALAQDAAPEGAGECFAEVVAVIALQGFFGGV